MRYRSWMAVSVLACATALGVGCVHPARPALPAEPPDVQGIVWAIKGSFEGGGEVVLRPSPTPEKALPLPARIQLRPGARILIRRGEKLDPVNFSKLQLGQQVTIWWDGQPAPDSVGSLTGPVRVVVIQ